MVDKFTARAVRAIAVDMFGFSPSGGAASLIAQCFRKNWQSAATGAVLSPIQGAEGAPRSCPAGWVAEVGLRWCGVTPP